MMSVFEPHAFGGECGQALGLAIRREVVDAERLPVHVAQVAQPLEERTVSCRPERPWIERQEAESGLARCWLRLHRERRKREAKSEHDREPDNPFGHLGGGCLAGV